MKLTGGSHFIQNRSSVTGRAKSSGPPPFASAKGPPNASSSIPKSSDKPDGLPPREV